MLEDPGCHMVLLGGDESGPMLVTVWDEEAVAEVAESLAALEARVRVLVITDPRRAGWAGWHTERHDHRHGPERHRGRRSRRRRAPPKHRMRGARLRWPVP